MLACGERRRNDRLADRAQLGRILGCQILVLLKGELDELGRLYRRAADHDPESEVDFECDNHGAPPLVCPRFKSLIFSKLRSPTANSSRNFRHFMNAGAPERNARVARKCHNDT